MSKLTWEWSGENQTQITIRKPRGKIAMQELIEFMHEPKQLNCFDGKLAIFMFRINSDADLIPFGWEEPAGDAQDLMVIENETPCPLCNHRMFLQYCPDCGRKLFGKETDK